MTFIKIFVVVISQNFIFFILIITTFFVCLPLSCEGRPGRCKSMDGQLGVCIPIQNCSSIFHKIADGPLSLDQAIALQKITCGFDRNDPRVCCPDIDVQLSKTQDAKIENSQHFLEFDESHPKIQLLPKPHECGLTNVSLSDRIIGGKVAPHGSQPWLVRLGYRVDDDDGLGSFCGASLILNRYVITAGHCVTGDAENEPVMVRLGEYELNKDPDCSPETGKCSYKMDFEIEKIIPHQNYNSETKQNDIALIRLARDVHFDTEFIRPICLPLEREVRTNFSNIGLTKDSSGVWGFVSGFGATKWDVLEESPILQFVQLPVVSNSDCQSIYNDRTIITKTQMCAGGEAGKDSCDGDSGTAFVIFSPAAKRHFQAGIVSFGPTRCGSEGLPGIYTRLASQHLTWILDTIEPS